MASVEIWSAAERGAPFDALIADANAPEESADILSQARDACGSAGDVKSIIMIDPHQRGEISKLKELGFDAYLVQPARPASSGFSIERNTRINRSMMDMLAG